MVALTKYDKLQVSSTYLDLRLFVIFHDITDIERRGFLHIISICNLDEFVIVARYLFSNNLRKAQYN